MESNKPTIAWSEVLKKHKTQTAVQFVENKIVSIICSPEQNQIISDEKIIFSIPNKKQYFKTIVAMQNCVGSNPDINVFIKRDKNVWIDSGSYRLISFITTENRIDFTFQK
jgi:hypothetical protein